MQSTVLVEALITDYKYVYDSLCRSLQAFEVYIEKAYDPNFKNNRQRFTNIDAIDESGIKENYLSTSLYQALTLTAIVAETPLPEAREYSLNQFYKWVDHSGINVERCPSDLAQHLITIHKSVSDKNIKLLEETESHLKKYERPKAKEMPAYFEKLQEVSYRNDQKLEKIKDIKADKKSIKNLVGELEGNVEEGKRKFEEIEKAHSRYHNDFDSFSSIDNFQIKGNSLINQREQTGFNKYNTSFR